MRWLYVLLFLLNVVIESNGQDNFAEKVVDIPAMELKGHARLFENAKINAPAASDNFDVKYYRGEWEVDPAIREIKGKVTVYFKMVVTGQSVSLDLMNDLTVSGVSQRGNPLTFTHSGNVLQINLPVIMPINVLDSLSVSYQGVPATTGFGSFIVSSHGTPSVPVMWTLSEPYGSRDWWPCKNGLDDKADSVDVFVTHPATFGTSPNIVGYRAASNGLLKSEVLLPSGKVVTHWKHKYPIASYLVCFAVTNYEVFDNSVMIGTTNLPMKTHCYPENKATFQAGTQNVLDAMVLFSNMFGAYPFIEEKYGHVQFGWGGGMEHQTSTFIVNVGESLVAHELAHHWFGDKITCSSWEDIWLNEGFATHLASIYMENKYPANILPSRASIINNITSQPGGSVRVDNVNDPNRIFSSRLSYYKGSHLLYMLRWILGDVDFFQAVRNYQNDPALGYGFATTANLKSHLETVSGKDLTYFFDQWYTGQGYPSYQVEWYTSGNSAGIKVNQTTSHASVPFFRLPVPLLFTKPSTGQQKLVVVDNIASGQTFFENIGFEAESVTIDPELWLITRNNTVTKIGAPLPVIFTSFQVNCEAGFSMLTWSTSSETNADHFEIQKSDDGSIWLRAGIVDAAGQSSTSQKYEFTDIQKRNNDAYYRIAEVDRDGKIQLTRIVHAYCGRDGNDQWNILPNPVQSILTVNAGLSDYESVKIKVFDASGKLIQRSGLNKSAARDQYSINVSDLSTGLYILNIEDGDVRKSLKFIKE